MRIGRIGAAYGHAVRRWAFPIALLLGIVPATGALAQASFREIDPRIFATPSAETMSAVAALQTAAKETQSFSGPTVFAWQVSPEVQSSLPFENGKAVVPLYAKDRLLVKLAPDVSAEALNGLIEQYGFVVEEKYPDLASILVQVDLSSHFKAEITDNSVNDMIKRGLAEVMKTYEADPRILVATPDTVFSTQQTITNMLTPSDIVMSGPIAQETKDWGITDIEADQLWQMEGAQDGATLGIVDAGFSRHEDLVFSGIVSSTPVDDHGNHVAGIACAKHNQIGTMGVLPNCFIKPKTEDFFFNSTEGGDVLNFVNSFSAILSSLNTFATQQDDVAAFNLSLGYNWMSNFGINPDAPGSTTWRTLVEGQGAFMVSILQWAQRNNKMVFSAAGNDSAPGQTISALYASPFNWAAIMGRKLGGIKSGVVVEAHTSTGDPAVFSNKDGSISCPGQDILSPIAHDATGARSGKAYGLMSGTSMASPYCAAAYALLSLVRPGRDSATLMDCLTTTNAYTSRGVPRVKLTQAVAACTP